MSQDRDIKKAVAIELTGDQALVLFEWIRRFNEGDAKDLEDQAEERVLWDIAAMLEKELVEPLAQDYDRLLAEARAAIAADLRCWECGVAATRRWVGPPDCGGIVACDGCSADHEHWRDLPHAAAVRAAMETT